jgi:hypothetical protein
VRAPLRLVVEACLLAAGTAVALTLLPPWRGVVLATSAFGVLVVGVAEAFIRSRAIAWGRASPFDDALEVRTEPPNRPADLLRLERAMGMRSYSAREFDHYVRPTLWSLARHRLQAAHGIDPEREPDAVRAVLPPPLWRLVAPHDRGTDAEERIGASAVAAMIDEIEAL